MIMVMRHIFIVLLLSYFRLYCFITLTTLLFSNWLQCASINVRIYAKHSILSFYALLCGVVLAKIKLTGMGKMLF